MTRGVSPSSRCTSGFLYTKGRSRRHPLSRAPGMRDLVLAAGFAETAPLAGPAGSGARHVPTGPSEPAALGGARRRLPGDGCRVYLPVRAACSTRGRHAARAGGPAGRQPYRGAAIETGRVGCRGGPVGVNGTSSPWACRGGSFLLTALAASRIALEGQSYVASATASARLVWSIARTKGVTRNDVYPTAFAGAVRPLADGPGVPAGVDTGPRRKSRAGQLHRGRAPEPAGAPGHRGPPEEPLRGRSLGDHSPDGLLRASVLRRPRTQRAPATSFVRVPAARTTCGTPRLTGLRP